MLKALAQRVALIFAGFLTAFVIAEVAVREFHLAPDELYTYDPYVGWKLKSGISGWQTHEGNALVAVNRDGFRGPDYTFDKAPGTLRIAILGDSFVEAQHVSLEDTFGAVAERALQSQCPITVGRAKRPRRTFSRVQVLNFGCDGYGTAQELITLQRWVWRYSPDVVVLAFFSGNDVRNNSVVLEGDKCRPFYVYRNGQLVLGGPFEDSWTFRLHCLLRFESRHSQVLNVLGDGRSQLNRLIQRICAKPPPAARGKRGTLAVEQGLNGEVYRPPSGPAWAEAWRISEAEIEIINRDVRAHGALFLTVTIPTGIQDDPNPSYRAKFMSWVQSDNLLYPDDHIRELGEKDGFAVLNLSKPMQEYAQANDRYLHGFANTSPGVGHLNVDGHRVAGNLIAERIRELLADNE